MVITAAIVESLEMLTALLAIVGWVALGMFILGVIGLLNISLKKVLDV